MPRERSSLSCGRTLVAREGPRPAPFEIYKRRSSRDRCPVRYYRRRVCDGWQEERTPADVILVPDRPIRGEPVGTGSGWTVTQLPERLSRRAVPLRDGATRVRGRHETGRPTPNQIAQFREFRKVVPRIRAADLRDGDASRFRPAHLFHFSLPFSTVLFFFSLEEVLSKKFYDIEKF